ncbi:MAG TPA: hypothetical protein VIY47_00755, partial [Ignavibacteriaceae bacterium]
MFKNNGKLLEQLVQVIEQLISPDSIVEHNVQMPVVNSKRGSAAQCDLVIRSGKKPRETITIVEVQDRNRPVEINEFRGWKQKLEDVGAQHLYCVSRCEFPESIKEQAALSGNAIKLITLKELNPEQASAKLFDFIFKYHDVDILHIHKDETHLSGEEVIALGISKDKIEQELKELKSNDLKFSFDKKNLTALSTLCIEKVPVDKDGEDGVSNLEFGFENMSPFYFYSNGFYLRMQLRITYKWTSKTVNIAPTIFSYDQNEHGALAWVLEAFYSSSRGPLWFKIPVIKNEDSFSIYGMFL